MQETGPLGVVAGSDLQQPVAVAVAVAVAESVCCHKRAADVGAVGNGRDSRV